tara:strand:- start:696 stop:1391 length:696 start_codon:yes stop_codon:yes gene_type:complete
MASAKLDIVLEEGSSWQKSILWTDSTNAPISLLGYFARLGIVKDYDDAASAQSIFLESDQKNGNGSFITVGEATGTIDITISSTDVAGAITGGFKRGFWDLELVPKEEISVCTGSFNDWNFDVVDAGNSNNATLTANHSSAALDTKFKNGQYVVVRGCAVPENDGMYKIGAVPTSTVLKFTTPGHSATDASSGNAAMSVFLPNEQEAIRLIGGKVRLTQSSTLRRSVEFET